MTAGRWPLARAAAVSVLTLTLFLLGAAGDDWLPGPFVKFSSNPILGPQGEGFESAAVLNPAVIRVDGTFYMLYRAEDGRGASRIGLATSEDGLRFSRRPEPVLYPTEPYEIWGGCEDPRVVEIDGVYYLTYTAYDGHWAKLSLATSLDLVNWEKHGPIIPWPWSKAGAILAWGIGGEYIMYFGDSSIWLARSPDLLHWEVLPEPVMRPRPGLFDSRGIEPGPPPILTDQGILLIYNGWDDHITYTWIREDPGFIYTIFFRSSSTRSPLTSLSWAFTEAGSCPKGRFRVPVFEKPRNHLTRFTEPGYKVGAVLFSWDDPTRVITRAEAPILEPTEGWELQGRVPRVVFASGLVISEGRWHLYYGGADERVGVAIYREDKQ